MASACAVQLTENTMLPRVVLALVEWELLAAGGRRLYTFEAAYRLASTDGALRISALAHNQLPRSMELVARLHTLSGRAPGST